MKTPSKFAKAALLGAVLATSLPVIAFARGEDAAMNRNDTMISSDSDRSTSRTESWTSAPRRDSQYNNREVSNTAYDNNNMAPAADSTTMTKKKYNSRTRSSSNY